MWKLLSVLSLTFCTFAMADDAPVKPSVAVKCSGRLRDGIVAIGGETTGTTITFNRIVWELQLHDEAARNFVATHNKEHVTVVGTLRKIVGTEVKVRWIVDVRTISKRDETKEQEGTQLAIYGTLRTTDARRGDSHAMTIESDRQSWPIDISHDAELQNEAASLVDKPVLLTGSLERVTEDEPSVSLIIRVKDLKQTPNLPDVDSGD